MADIKKILVDKTNLESTQKVSDLVGEALDEGEVRLEVTRFALTTNNVTYAFAGSGLGYWNFYPEPDPWGCIPVWGFAKFVESRCQDIEVGEEVFGFLPTSQQVHNLHHAALG